MTINRIAEMINDLESQVIKACEEKDTYKVEILTDMLAEANKWYYKELEFRKSFF